MSLLCTISPAGSQQFLELLFLLVSLIGPSQEELFQIVVLARKVIRGINLAKKEWLKQRQKDRQDLLKLAV